MNKKFDFTRLPEGCRHIVEQLYTHSGYRLARTDIVNALKLTRTPEQWTRNLTIYVVKTGPFKGVSFLRRAAT